MAEKRGLLAEFREFILRGNVVDLAIAVVIGTAFAAVVKSFVADLVTPIVSIFSAKTNFADLAFRIRGARFAYGDFLNNLVAFVIVAAVVFFFVLKPINFVISRRKKEVAEEEAKSDEVVLLTEIRDLLRQRAS